MTARWSTSCWKFPRARDVFLRGLRAWVGFKQTGVPYVRPERAFGITTNSFFKNIWWAKKAIFSFSLKPLHYIHGPGAGSSSQRAWRTNVAVLPDPVRRPHPPEGAKGITTIVLLVLGLGGMQLFSLSILGDYLGKVLEETKARPRYIRARVFKRAGTVIAGDHAMNDFLGDAFRQSRRERTP